MIISEQMPGNEAQHAIGRRTGLALLASGVLASGYRVAHAAVNGTLTIAVHVSLPPSWLDPSEMPALSTTYMLVYALPDAMVKPMPEGNPVPCMAESFPMSPDG